MLQRVSRFNGDEIMVLLGSHASEETRRKMSESLKGKIPWNKGLKKEDNESVMKISLALKGKPLAEETKKKMSIVRTGKKMPPLSKEWHEKQSIAHKGKKLSEEQKKKISEAVSGEKHPMYGRHHTEEARLKMHNMALNRVFPVKDTKIEVLLQEGLKKRNIKFEKHIPVCNICQPDIIFPELKIAVFADGDYWHSKTFKNGKQWKKDRNQDGVLSENNWIVLRFWEHEIHSNPEECINKIIATMRSI